jgi:hypothetical protein
VQVLDEARPDVEERFDALLPRAFAIVGQPDLPTERLDRAPGLRALLNVEGNFFPNVDYATCFARGVHVLGCGPAYATAVAEYASRPRPRPGPRHLARGRAFRAGPRALRLRLDRRLDPAHRRGRRSGRLRQPGAGAAPAAAALRPTLRIYDPWLPDSVIAEQGGTPSPLPELLEISEFVFVLATVTAESEHLLGDAELDGYVPGRGWSWSAGPRCRLRRPAAPGGRRPVPGRRRRLADEPVPPDHPARSLEDLVLSAHRAAASRLPFARSATWWSTIWPRSPAACRRCGCRWPAGSWSPATAIRPVT